MHPTLLRQAVRIDANGKPFLNYTAIVARTFGTDSIEFSLRDYDTFLQDHAPIAVDTKGERWLTTKQASAYLKSAGDNGAIAREAVDALKDAISATKERVTVRAHTRRVPFTTMPNWANFGVAQGVMA